MEGQPSSSNFQGLIWREEKQKERREKMGVGNHQENALDLKTKNKQEEKGKNIS